MSRHPRTPTRIKVQVVDLSQIQATALERWKAQNPEATGQEVPLVFESYATVGYVEMPDGSLYVLDNEGVGALYTASEKDKAIKVALYPKWVGAVAIFPTMEGSYSVEGFKDLPVTETVLLSHFIRTFGDRLWHNYENTRSFLTEKLEEGA
jgi:hypothetical protein